MTDSIKIKNSEVDRYSHALLLSEVNVEDRKAMYEKLERAYHLINGVRAELIERHNNLPSDIRRKIVVSGTKKDKK